VSAPIGRNTSIMSVFCPTVAKGRSNSICMANPPVAVDTGKSSKQVAIGCTHPAYPHTIAITLKQYSQAYGAFRLMVSISHSRHTMQLTIIGQHDE